MSELVMSDVIKEFKDANGVVPYIDLDGIRNIPADFIDKFGETDFKKAVQRNIEREVIGKEAALMSIASRCIVNKTPDNIDVAIVASKAGGVTISYPASTAGGKSGEKSLLKDKVTELRRLDRAEVSYLIGNEAQIVGDVADINAEYMMEANEQLAAEMDNTIIKHLNAGALTDNTEAAEAKWDTANPVPEKDIATAIKNLIVNSAIDPNRRTITNVPQWTLILPIAVYDKLNEIRVIDGSKLTLGDYVQKRYDLQVIYSRKPFEYKSTWPISTDGILIPTFDRKVGNLHLFDGGGRVPNQYTSQTASGLEVDLNWWMNFFITPDEKDATLDKSRRIAKITGIL